MIGGGKVKNRQDRPPSSGHIWHQHSASITFGTQDARWTARPPCDRPPAGNREDTSMSDYDRNYAARGFGAAQSAAIDAGLRAYMLRVYNYMAAGVALTGVVAWFTYMNAAVTDASGKLIGLTPFGQTIYGGAGMIVLFLGTLGIVFFMSFRINRLSVSTASLLFLVYAALLGVMLSSVFLTYTHGSIARTFFVSAASFGALSLYGYTTQR